MSRLGFLYYDAPKLAVAVAGGDAISVLSVTEHVVAGSLTPDPYTAFSITLDASAKAVVLLTAKSFANDHIDTTGHTFGGVAMTHIGAASQVLTAVEGTVHAMFLGSGLPAAGSRSFSVNLTGTTSDPYVMYAIQLAGDGDMEVVDWDTDIEEQSNPSVVLSYGGRRCLSVGTIYSGVDAPASLAVLSGMTNGGDHDLGNESAMVAYQTSSGTSDFTFGWTVASDDVAMIALAVSVIGS